MWCCVNWWNARSFESGSSIQMNAVCFICLQTTSLVMSGWTPLLILIFFFFRNPAILHSVATLKTVRQIWRPIVGFFARNICCDILIGWGCSGDWQHGTLYCQEGWRGKCFQRMTGFALAGKWELDGKVKGIKTAGSSEFNRKGYGNKCYMVTMAVRIIHLLTLCADSSSVFVPPPCYRRGTWKSPVILPKVQVTGYT